MTSADPNLLKAVRSIEVWPGSVPERRTGCSHALTVAEEAVVASAPFQRLHRLRQMGLAFHAWPNAENTRASHSYGVAYWSTEYLKALRLAPHAQTQEGVAAAEADLHGLSLEVVVRLFGLLHDIDLLPLGHTLRYQSGLFPEGRGQPRLQACVAAIKEHAAGETWSAALHDHLDAAVEPGRLKSEIVNSGLGADLVDFALRDSFAITRPQRFPAGLPAALRLVDTDGGWRLALDISDPASAASRVAMADDLYTARFEVFQASVFHPVKLAADAMFDLLMRRIGVETCRAMFPEDRLLAIGDDELLDALVAAEPEGGGAGAALRNGRLHEEVWRTDDLAAFRRHPEAERALALDPTWRTEAEAALAARLPWAEPGDLIVAVSEPTMQAKPADARFVDAEGEVFTLAEAAVHGFETRAEATARRYEELWSLRIYLSPRKRDQAASVATAAEAQFCR